MEQRYGLPARLLILDIGVAIEHRVPEQPAPPADSASHYENRASSAEYVAMRHRNAAVDPLTNDPGQIRGFRELKNDWR